MAAGEGLCDRQIVDMVIQEAAKSDSRVHPAPLLRHPRRRNGPSRRKADTVTAGIVHALGDATGLEVMRAMAELIRSRPQRVDLGVDVHDRPLDARRFVSRSPASGWLARAEGAELSVWAKQTILGHGTSRALLS